MRNHDDIHGIVATLGPASHDLQTVKALARAGVTIFRMNMSKRDHEWHASDGDHVRSAAKDLGIRPLVMADLMGPRIRLGEFENDEIEIAEGDTFTLTTVPCVGNASRAFISYDRICGEVAPGTVILADDGQKKLVVESVTDDTVVTRVAVGGRLRSRPGINIPNAYLSIDVISGKDRADILFGIEHGVDLFAVSFVRKAEDVLELRSILATHSSDIRIVSKIETPEALENIDAIIDVSDAVMVARGDLGVEIGYEYVPRAQKMIVRKCNEKEVPVIVATDMMSSMRNSATPSRADVSDVANAVLDGADAVMLSGETAVGSFPVETVRTMARIVEVYAKGA